MRQLIILNRTAATPAVLRALYAIPEMVDVITTDLDPEELHDMVKTDSINNFEVRVKGSKDTLEDLIDKVKKRDGNI